MTNITRRAALGGLAALPAAAIPVGADAALPTPDHASHAFAGPGIYRLRTGHGEVLRFVDRLPRGHYFRNRFLQVHADAATRDRPGRAESLISRAAFPAICLGLIAALPAANVPQENVRGEKPEQTGDRLTRLVAQLSEVLDEVNAHASTFAHEWGDCDTVGVWVARVLPSRISKQCFLEQMDLPRAYVRFYTGKVAS